MNVQSACPLNILYYWIRVVWITFVNALLFGGIKLWKPPTLIQAPANHSLEDIIC
jgi:hypothetical protein